MRCGAFWRILATNLWLSSFHFSEQLLSALRGDDSLSPLLSMPLVKVQQTEGSGAGSLHWFSENQTGLDAVLPNYPSIGCQFSSNF